MPFESWQGEECLSEEELAAQLVFDQSDAGFSPQLVVVEVGNHNYDRLLKAWRDLDRRSEVLDMPMALRGNAGLKATMGGRREEIICITSQLSKDDAVHGILVDGSEILATTHVTTGIAEVLLKSKASPCRRNAISIRRSTAVRTPVARLLQLAACHSGNEDLVEHVRQADIELASVERPAFVLGSWLRKDAVVIDVGMNFTDADQETNFETIAHNGPFEGVGQAKALIEPVPRDTGDASFEDFLQNVAKLAWTVLGPERSLDLRIGSKFFSKTPRSRL